MFLYKSKCGHRRVRPLQLFSYGASQLANKLPNNNCATGNIVNGKFTAGPWAEPWYAPRKIQPPRLTDLWVLVNNAASRIFRGNHWEHKIQHKLLRRSWPRHAWKNVCSIEYVEWKVLSVEKKYKLNNSPISTQNSISTACNDEASVRTASQNQWYAIVSNKPWENQLVLTFKHLSFSMNVRRMIPVPSGISVLYIVSLMLIPTNGGVDVPNC